MSKDRGPKAKPFPEPGKSPRVTEGRSYYGDHPSWRIGRMDFVDQSVHKTHELRELHLAVPFLSNLPSKREIKTSPHLAFKLNGSSFDTAAEGTPFAQTRKTDASIALRGFDLLIQISFGRGLLRASGARVCYEASNEC